MKFLKQLQKTIFRSFSKEGKATIERKLPDTITDWIANTVCISAKHGLGIAAPAQITAFQPFFLDYSLPYSVKRGEQLRLKVSLYNYMAHGLPVLIRLVGYDGLDLAFNSSTEAIFCVGAKDSVVHEYTLIPRQLGDVNVTVAAEIDKEQLALKKCGTESIAYTR